MTLISETNRLPISLERICFVGQILLIKNNVYKENAFLSDENIAHSLGITREKYNEYYNIGKAPKQVTELLLSTS